MALCSQLYQVECVRPARKVWTFFMLKVLPLAPRGGVDKPIGCLLRMISLFSC